MTQGRVPHHGHDGTGHHAAGRHDTPSIDELARDIAARLRPVCTHCDELEFAALVRRIATVELKYKLAGEMGTGRAGGEPLGHRFDGDGTGGDGTGGDGSGGQTIPRR